MLIHSVFFYLRDDLTPEQKKEFRRNGLESLRAIRALEALYIGTPAPTAPRPSIDTGYTYGITCVFKDVAAHNAYQVDPLHQAFGEKYQSYWQRVQVYDLL